MTQPTSDPHADSRDRADALALMEESAAMTLAVTTADGPWAAPVYYVYRPADGGFYFFSSPDSRHVAAALEAGGCGAAIFRPSDTWQDICGLQMRGALAPVSPLDGIRALAHYLKKFPFSRDLLPSAEDSLESFRNQMGVGLYRFRAQQMEWMNNRIRFGYRRKLTL